MDFGFEPRAPHEGPNEFHFPLVDLAVRVTGPARVSVAYQRYLERGKQRRSRRADNLRVWERDQHDGYFKPFPYLKIIVAFRRKPHISSKNQKKGHFRSNTSLMDSSFSSGLTPHPKHACIAFTSFQAFLMLPIFSCDSFYRNVLFIYKYLFLNFLMLLNLLASYLFLMIFHPSNDPLNLISSPWSCGCGSCRRRCSRYYSGGF